MNRQPYQKIKIHNLDFKLTRKELKTSLPDLFSQFGEIVNIGKPRTSKNRALRGQAFILFRELGSAINALQTMNGYIFHDKPMRITYAQFDPDIIARLEGTFLGRKRITQPKPTPSHQGPKKIKPPKSNPSRKKSKKNASNDPDSPSSNSAIEQAPNQILFLRNLPEETNDMMLSMLFNQFPGFKEVRLVPNRHDMAFVEFATELQSSAAKDALQGFKITPSHAMKITFV